MPINANKMKQDSSFSIHLPENIFAGYTQNVCDYFATLAKNINNISPSDAVDVLSALSAFREYFDSEHEWERLTLHMLGTVRKGLQRSHYDKIAGFSGLTHVAFAVYDLSISTPKLKPFLMEINKLLLNYLSVFLEPSGKEEFYTAGNYEVIYGLSGPLRYLLNFNNDNEMKDMAERIVDVFIKRSKDTTILGHKVPGWHYYPTGTEKAFSSVGVVNGCINYGVSHGMGGPLVTLALAYSQGIRKEETKKAVNQLANEYMKALYYVNNIAYWPGKISAEQYIGLEETEKVPTQMSWCYGSPGILRALYVSGVLMSDYETAKFATDELVKIANMDLTAYLLTQPIVCHGWVGTAAILNLMYLDTGKAEFLQKTMEMVGHSAMFNIGQFFEMEKQRIEGLSVRQASLHCHLEGYNGIVQTVLSIIKGCTWGNERRLMML